MTWAIVPIKSFHGGKSRLSDALSQNDRSQLIEMMFLDVVAALQASNRIEHVVVISRDPVALSKARELGLTALREPDGCSGLNQGLTHALDYCFQQGAISTLIIHADLPLATAQDIDFLIDRHSKNRITLVPSNEHTGTNAMVMDLPAGIPLSFGVNSYYRHHADASLSQLSPRTIALPMLSLDIDTTDDLAALTRQIDGTLQQKKGYTVAFIDQDLYPQTGGTEYGS